MKKGDRVTVTGGKHAGESGKLLANVMSYQGLASSTREEKKSEWLVELKSENASIAESDLKLNR